MSVVSSGIVLTGGRSRRMGVDKAFLEVDGRPMVVAVADALWEGGCQPVECQGGDVDGLAALGLDAVADTEPGRGPVGAIAEALARRGGPIVVAACDLPDLDADTVRAVDTAGPRAGRVAYARAEGRAHLVSGWPASALAALRRLVAAGPVGHRDALAALDAVPVEVDPDLVRNVNTPDDVDR